MPWKAPTRRAFLAMLGVGATAAVVLPRTEPVDPAPSPAPTRPIWIGHC